MVILASLETSQNTVDSHPLQFTTDWTTTVVGLNTTYTPSLTNTYTNSNCSASGQPVAMTLTSGILGPTIVMTLDNSQTVQFSPLITTASSVTGTVTSTGGGCTNGDTGSFSAVKYSALSGTYTGSIESYALTNPVNVTITLATAATWHVTGTVQASNKTCLANLDIATAAANAIDPSFASGDIVEIIAWDSNGNIAGFVLSATDQNGNALTPAWPAQFFTTYTVLAGSCAGDGGTDAPFKKVEFMPPHFPIGRLPLRGPELPVRIWGPEPPTHDRPLVRGSEIEDEESQRE
ncbi:MAG TPA: hypothetical protein VGD60_02780 [Candidatus Acidoferrales bacterium]